MINKLIEFYGNRGWKFDLLLSILVIASLFLLNLPIDIVNGLLDNIDEATISFFGIIVGFLLTTFSLLFLYNPEHSQSLMLLRKHKVYKSMLYAFISTAFITIILTITLLGSKIFVQESSTVLCSIVLGLGIFSFLRIIKCIFYLYAIIKLS